MIPLNRSLINRNEEKNINDCINSNWILSGGKYLQIFEKSFSKFLNTYFSSKLIEIVKGA
jgi:dTDP-4-amino-4,6-dideoxygalactose transaminase